MRARSCATASPKLTGGALRGWASRSSRAADPTGDVQESLRAQAEELSSLADASAQSAEYAAERARVAARALADADPARARRPDELVLERLHSGALRLEAARGVAGERVEVPVRERAEAQAPRTTELGADLRRLGAAEGRASTVGCAPRRAVVGGRRSSLRAQMPNATRPSDELRLPQPRSKPKAMIAPSWPRSSSATTGGASSSVRSIRSRRRSTTPRRSASKSSRCSASTSRNRSASSRSCATT